MKYLGALFDYDGTLTARYHNEIPKELIQTAVELNRQGVMMGICTARSFGSALPKFGPFLEAIGQDMEVRKNWVLICENGSKGYKFNEITGEYDEFYSAEWPQQVDREALYQRLLQEFEPHADILKNGVSFEIFQREDAPLISADPSNIEDLQQPEVEKNDVSIILRPTGRTNMGPKEWEIASGIIYQKILTILKEFDPQGLLHAGDSKMGVSILPANGDKDRGIREFASLVSSTKGVKIEHPFKEIVAVGDQAAPGGNDHYFLKGEVGTTFNVGEEDANESTAQRVLDVDGKPLIGPAGTLQVLKNLF